MQWETKVKFSGQVKSAGIDKGTHWKLGSVDFDYDAVSSSWLVKLYLKVNPNRVCQQMTIRKPDQLDVKSGRLMIEDKKGDGIHIKLSTADVVNAKRLVEKIKYSVATTDSYNKAEVGLRPAPPLPVHRGSENIRPVINDSFGDRSSVRRQEDCSPERQSGGWLSKMTPPMKRRDHNPAPKRRLELFSPERDKGSYSDREENTDRHGSSLKFTGMKDFSKRDITGGALTNGLGPKSFYGSQNCIVNSAASLGSISVSSNNFRGTDHSPALKKYKLSPSPSFGSQSSNKMPPARVSYSTSPPDSHESASGRGSQEVSLQNNGTPRHLRAGETIGFENLGNTCFLNSPLQCLSSLEPLCLDIQSAIAEYGSELNCNTMTRKLYLLMKDVRKLDVCPDRVRDILIRLRQDMSIKFAPNTQQDAHELLSELLNRIDEEVKAASQRYQAPPRSLLSAQGAVGQEAAVRSHPGEEKSSVDGAASQAAKYTPTEANFCWSYRTCISFHECKTEVLSAQTEQEMTLMLAFDSSTKTLQDCINKYFESTEVEMKCEKCGRDEKATITRKIVRRPRYFILNLLRYHTDNMETSKKADHIFIPSYISVCGYCAEDVAKPPHMDSVFMLESRNQTKKVCFKPLKFEDKSLSDTSTELPDLLADHVSSDTYERDPTAVQRPRSRSNEEGNRSESSAESSDFLPELVECVSCNLRFVDRFLEDAQLKGSNIRELYEYAHAVTSMTASLVKSSKRKEFPDVQQPNEGADDQSSDQNLLVCQELLKTAFNVVGVGAVTEHAQNNILQQIIKELVATRYAHIPRDKSLDHLIGDLAMYVSAVKCRILTADDEAEIVASETIRKVLSNTGQLDEEEPHRKSASDWGSRVPSSEYDSRGKPWLGDEASKLKSCDSTHHSQGKPWSLHETNKSISKTSLSDKEYIEDSMEDSTKGDRCLKGDNNETRRVTLEGSNMFDSSNKSLYMKSAEGKWKGPHSDEENSVDLSIYSSSEHPPAEEQFLCNPRKSGLKLRIKNIKMFTEDELQKIDCSSLTEEEMLTYAQALSRFAYERERAAQMDLSATGSSDLMDVCGSFEKPEDESSFGEVPDSRTQPEGSSLKGALNSTTEIDIEGISATSSMSSITKSDESGFLSPSKKTSSVSKFSRSTNSAEAQNPGQDSNIEPNLLCLEDLNDEDETDGGKIYSELHSPSQVQCANILRSSTSITEAHLVPDLGATQAKPCISCGSLCYTACTSCGAVDQTDFELNTSDNYLSPMSANTLAPSDKFTDKLKFSPPKEFPEKHTESSHRKPVKDSDLSDFKNKETTKVSPTEGHSLSKQKSGSNSQLMPPSPQSCKKEYLFSPSKTSNLVKTRDYARLRSPSASPKKKTPKVCTSKRLHFAEDDKDKKASPSLFGKDENISSSSDSLGTSMEVQVDEMTFLESIDVSSFSDPLPAPSKGQHSTPKPDTSKNVSPLLKSLTKDTSDSASPSHHSLIDKNNSTSSSSTPVVEESECIHHSSGVIQQASAKSEQLATVSHSGKVREISLQENVESEVTDVRLKSSKQMTDVTADTEEKENLYKYEARAKQLQNIELGRAEQSYKLVGVVDHTGNTQFTGHYTAYAFNMSKQKWFHLNDSETRVVTEREVQENNTQTGYLFFYMDKLVKLSLFLSLSLSPSLPPSLPPSLSISLSLSLLWSQRGRARKTTHRPATRSST